jgi:hypothetical protein
MADAAPQTPNTREMAENAGLISILAIGRHSLGRDLRLKAEDVITAIDGEPITYDVDKFDNLLRDYKDLPALLTIFRDGKLFDVFVNGSLGCSYKYADEPTIMAVNSAMQGREKKPKDSYYQYEALRNIHREVRLYSTQYEPMATMLPAFWLLYRRMWEPLGVVVITYAMALFIQPALFVLVYLLLSVYFHKAQTDMIRSHCLYHEYYFWMIFAASSTKEAQQMLRVFDPKCQFEFSHVGPPEKTDSKAAANSPAQTDSPAQADNPA